MNRGFILKTEVPPREDGALAQIEVKGASWGTVMQGPQGRTAKKVKKKNCIYLTKKG